MTPRRSIYHGATLFQVREQARRRREAREEDLLIAMLARELDDIYGCMSPPLSSVTVPGQDQGK